MRSFAVLVAIGLCTLAAGCAPGPKSPKGFSLPDGNVDRGEKIFVELRCHACHSVQGVELPTLPEEEVEMSVALGGPVSRVKTYGNLVTSIINPSHRLAKAYKSVSVGAEGESKMTNYNDTLTVSQLIDLVAFLQAHYELTPYDSTEYAPYF